LTPLAAACVKHAQDPTLNFRRRSKTSTGKASFAASTAPKRRFRFRKKLNLVAAEVRAFNSQIASSTALN
jgi:hypothetical protein